MFYKSEAFYLSFLHLSRNMKCKPKKTHWKLIFNAVSHAWITSNVFEFIPWHYLLRVWGLLDKCWSLRIWDMASYSGPEMFDPTFIIFGKLCCASMCSGDIWSCMSFSYSIKVTISWQTWSYSLPHFWHFVNLYYHHIAWGNKRHGHRILICKQSISLTILHYQEVYDMTFTLS